MYIAARYSNEPAWGVVNVVNDQRRKRQGVLLKLLYPSKDGCIVQGQPVLQSVRCSRMGEGLMTPAPHSFPTRPRASVSPRVSTG